MGLGYLVERGISLGKPADGSEGKITVNEKVDMARLLGRTPRGLSSADSNNKPSASNELKMLVDGGEDGKDDTQVFTGSGLGSEWDDRVGAGAAAASIVSLFFSITSLSFCTLIINKCLAINQMNRWEEL